MKSIADQYRNFHVKYSGDTASDTGFLKYWQYTWRYHKSIADTSDSDTSIAILTTLQEGRSVG